MFQLNRPVIGVLMVCIMGCLTIPLPAQSYAPESSAQEEIYLRFLKRKARSGTVAERTLAMNRLARIGFSTVLPVLEKGLNDEDQRVRLAAVDAIGQVRHPSTRQFLKQALFSGEPLLSSSAAERITKRAPSFGVPLLLKGMEHDSRVVRSGAFSALEQWTGYRFSYNPASNADERKQALRRWRAWWSDNRERSKEEWWLSRVRTAGNESGQLASVVAAIQKLTEARSWGSLPEFIDLLNHPLGPIRIQALHGLREIALYRFDDSSVSPDQVATRVRSRWLKWWQTHGSSDRASWLVEQLRVYSLMEQVQAVLVIPNRNEKLVQELSDPEVEVSPSHLASMLDGSKGEQEYAVRILRGRTGLSFGSIETGRQEREEVIDRWRELVNKWGVQPRESLMTHMLAHGERPENRRVAARYLGTMYSEKAVSSLIRSGLQDRNGDVRERSIASLTALTGRRFNYRAEASEADRSAAVRRWKRWWNRQEQFFEYRRW